MSLKTPRDWYRRNAGRRTVTHGMALGLSVIWAAATARRLARAHPLDAGAPVICVGNLTLGGAGKTPIVRELTRYLSANGRAAKVLARGYGGRLAGPIRVDPARHGVADVGDEALMMSADADVWIARDRAAGARAAADDGAEVIVMDDGHQNPCVRRALSLVVVDGETRDGEWPFGDGAVFPAGPMREPLSAGLARADAVVLLMPQDAPAPNPELLVLLSAKPILIARLTAAEAPPAGPQLVFAGLGKPWKMERALKAAGCDLVDFVALPDHARLSDRLLAGLARRAADRGAGLLTSEKDWVRLSPAWRGRVTSWPVRARFENEAALGAMLEAALNSR